MAYTRVAGVCGVAVGGMCCDCGGEQEEGKEL